MSEIKPGKIYKAMIEIAKKIDAIGKDRKNVTQNFNFRGIDDVYNAVHDLMAAEGVFSLPTILSESREERTTKNGGLLLYTKAVIKYTFYADDGSSVECSVIGEGMDSGDKASNKAMAIAHKYAIVQAFSIPTKENSDPDAESHEPMPKKPPVAAKAAPIVKPQASAQATQARPAQSKDAQPATDGQRKLIWARLKSELQMDDAQAKDFITRYTGLESSKEMTRAHVNFLLNAIDDEAAKGKAQVEPGWEG